MHDPLTTVFLQRGWAVVPRSAAMCAWVDAARPVARAAMAAAENAHWYRHQKTWFVGVNVLDNDADGAIGPVPLAGPALTLLGALGYPVAEFHKAQISAVMPGYPGRDPEESDAAAAFRLNRDAAHVDGLLPVGAERRRMLKEPHAYVLGIPLSDPEAGASPLAIWEASHLSIGQAFRAALEHVPQEARAETDLTEIYQAARRTAFQECPRRLISARPGEALILHRHMLHGISPWTGESETPRIVAYFRPQVTIARWLCVP